MCFEGSPFVVALLWVASPLGRRAYFDQGHRGAADLHKMNAYWLRREEPPWSDELYAFIIRSRLPGTAALIAVVLATVDIWPAWPWLLAFLLGLLVVNSWTLRRATSHRQMPEAVGLIEMAGPVLLGFWVPGLLYPALLMSVTSVVFSRLIYGPRITLIGMVIVAAIASLQTALNPVPYAAVSIAVFFVTGIRLVAALDVLARREFSLADRLRERAERDHLTGLANRSSFVGHLEARLTEYSADRGPSVRLLYIDVDDFKTVNDTLGHHHGDLFLVEVARRLLAVAPDAVVARIGGDEFAVLIEEDAEGRAAGTSTRVHETLKAPIRIGEVDLTATVSIGEAIGPEHGSTVAELINSADVAMYAAKASHGSSRLYDAGLADGGRRAGRGHRSSGGTPPAAPAQA